MQRRVGGAVKSAQTPIYVGVNIPTGLRNLGTVASQLAYSAMDRINKILRILVGALSAFVIADVALAQIAGFRIHAIDWVLAGIFLGLLIAAALGRVPARVSLGVLSTVGCWIVVEATVGLLAFDYERPFAWYIWPPGYECRVVPHEMPGVDEPGRFTINSVGLRAPEFGPDNEYRILCVGGSTTECLYQDDGRTWIRELAKQLQRDGGKVWVGNAGRSGLNTTDHVTLLTHLPEAHQVDCWLVLCGVNDMGQQLAGVYEKEVHRTWRHTFAYRRPGFGGRWKRPLYQNAYSVAAVSQFAESLQQGWTTSGKVVQDKQGLWYADNRRKRKQAIKFDELPDMTAMLQEYERQLRKIIAVAREQDKRLIFMTQPCMWSPEITPENESLCWAGVCPNGTYRSSAALAEAMGAYNERMRAVCRDEAIELVDLDAQLAKSTATFYDDCHFNDAGSLRVAQLTGEIVQPKILARMRGARGLVGTTNR